jgi:DNA repair exonuclease SbcCD ATPase subunit
LTGLRALLQEAYQAADWERFAKVPQAEALIAQVQALVEAMPAAVEQAQASEQTAQSDDASEAAATDAPAEEEASQESAKAAPDAVQELLNQHRVASDAWKKMGALPRDANNRLWDAFKTAGDALYAAAEPYFAAENETRQANLAAKQQLVSRLQAIIDDLSLEMTGAAGAGVGVVASGGDGRQRHQDVQGLMKEWQAAGPLPREYAKELNGTWKALLDKHFSRRRQEMAALTAAQQENLPAKTAAVEGLQGLVARLGTPNSRTTEVYDEWQRLRRDYFSAGQVPRDDYQRLRADFEAAEEALNDGLADHLATLAEANEASVAERRVIVAELAEIASEEHPRWFADQVQALRQRWRDCGRLDRSQKGVEREYFDLLQAIDEDRTVPLAPATAESSSEEDSPAIDTESPQQGAPA